MANLGQYSWPSSIGGTGTQPADDLFVDNIKIYDSTFSNNAAVFAHGTDSSGNPLYSSYGNIYFTGVKNLNINRIIIDETNGVTGGYGIKGTWAKNLNIAQCDCRVKLGVAGNADGFSIEAGYVTGGDIFDNRSNGGISMGLQYDVRIHHNRIVVPAGSIGGIGIEFGGYRSVADYNYFENTGGITVWGTADTVKIQHTVFRNVTGSVFVSTGDTPNGPSSARNIDVDNNTIDGNRPLYYEGAVSFRVQHAPAVATLSNIRIRNNIIANSQQSGLSGGAISLNGINASCTNSNGILNVSISNNLFYQNLPGDFTPNCGVPTTQQGNKFATNPAFTGGMTFPAPYYRLATNSPARAAGIFIGLPYNLAGPPDIGAYVQPATGSPIEAEMAYSVAANVGTNSAVQVGDFTLASAGHAVTLYDVGDKARVHFNVYNAGSYRIFARVRSGSTNASTAYFQSGAYSYRLDGNPIALTADLSTISAFDPSGGGVFWGTMKTQPIALTAGPHSIEVGSAGAWAMLDYVVIQ